jgi:hypothetical protein
MGYKRYNYKSVYMGSSYYQITVSPEGYRQIWELVQRLKVCEVCNEYYSEENPNVAGNMCLRCLLSDHPGLSFMGRLNPEATAEQEENPAFLFLSKKDGHTYTSKAGPGVQATVSEDQALTLKYWRFPIPTQGRWNGETVELSESGWYIYGDVRTDDLLLIEKGNFLFLVQRNGEALQITRRSSKHRFLLDAIRADLEATRRPPYNDYFFDGEEHPRVLDLHVYQRFVKEVNEARRAALAEQEELEKAVQAAEAAETTPDEADQSNERSAGGREGGLAI